ncbi:MAG: DUF4936 family protein [Lautropia sp.]
MIHASRTLFVYYRVDALHGERLIGCFARQRDAMDGVDASLARRCDPSVRDRRDDVRTWMETYRFDAVAPVDDLSALQARVESAALASGLAALALDGRRHEWFERCA